MINPIIKNLNRSKKLIESEVFIVGIGASGGGLDALEAFFKNLPENSAFTYIVILHLPTENDRKMHSFLQRISALPVISINHEMPLQRGKVYVAPPGFLVHIHRKKFQLKRQEVDARLNYSIDYFFKSLAKNFREKSVGIILSGAGSDGTEGLKAIKRKNGLTLVQFPESAKFDSMPRSAIQTKKIDFVLRAEQMPKKLLIYSMIKKDRLKERGHEQNEGELLGQILKRVLQKQKISLNHFKNEVIKEKIQIRLKLLQKSGLLEYLNYLFQNDEEISLLSQLVISPSRTFFDKKNNWDAFFENYFPQVVKKAENGQVNIWIPACGTGELAYTFAIYILEYQKLKKQDISFRIFATDAIEKVVSKAKDGIFSKDALRLVGPQIRSQNFLSHQEGFLIKSSVRDLIIFQEHNLITDPPLQNMDLVICQNYLELLENNTQQKVLSILNYAMKSGAFLMTGKRDQVQDKPLKFYELVDHGLNLFRKTINQSSFQISSYQNFNKSYFESNRNRRNLIFGSNQNHKSILDGIHEKLVQELASACFVINRDFELIQFFGKSSRFLQLPRNSLSWNILKMVPLDTAAAIRSGVRSAIHENKVILIEGLHFSQGNGNYIQADLKIFQYQLGTFWNPQDCIFLVLKDRNSDRFLSNFASSNSFNNHGKIDELKKELKNSRENFQAIIEELQSSNSDLIFFNEEMIRVNEELKRFNETLQLSNNENQQTISKLNQSYTDIENLLQNAHIGTIFLDKDLCIRKFNSVVLSLFSLTTLDIGRPIHHFSHKLNHDNLMEDIDLVFESNRPLTKEVNSVDDKWYLLHIFPVFNDIERFSGLVINLVDISAVKNIEHHQYVLLENKRLEQRILKLETEKQALEANLNVSNLIWNSIFQNNPNWFLKFNFRGSYQILHEPPNKQLEGHLSDEIIESLIEKVNTILKDESDEVVTMQLFLKDPAKPHLAEFKIFDDEHCLICIRDISQISLLKNEIEKKRLLFNQLTAQLPDTNILIFDQYGKCAYSSVNYSLNQVENQSVKEFFEAAAWIKIEKSQRLALRGKGSEFEMFHKGDLISVTVRPLYYHSENVEGSIMYLQKITDVKQVKKELEDRLDEMKQFAYAVSHDLKTPVRSITSFGQLMQKRFGTSLGVEGNQFLDYIVNNGREMSELINGLLHFSLVGSEKDDPQWFDVELMLDKVISKLGPGLEQDGIQIIVKDLPSILGHELHVSQVFQNLIENGLKFNESEQKQISISAEKGQGSWTFSVHDNGIGIEESYIPQIFTVFKRLHTKEKFAGSGIGLALCKKIIERMGGKIWVESKLGKGTTFFMEFPEKIVNG